LAPPTGGDAWDLLHFSQPSEDLSAGNWPEDNLLALKIVEDYARLHPARRVAIKLHPASWALGFRPPPIRHAHLVSTESLDLIRSARVVIVGRSTTGLEAMSLGRPVLQIPARGYIGPTEFIAESGAARQVESVEELATAMDQLLSDPTAYADEAERGRAYARSFIHGFGQPGAAVRALAALVGELRQS
jgi:glycosyltransferase involved in cell wall biosynthesis